MGIYLNPTNEGFWTAVRSEIYVDKTGLISCTNRYLNTEQKYFWVSRPRRFGKSMALKMLAAYYSCGCDSRELFAGLKIEENQSFSEYLNRFDVIWLNMQQFVIRAKEQELIEYLERVVLEDIRETYEELLPEDIVNLAVALEKVYAKTGKQFIFLVDEWDCVMRERQDSGALQKQYLDFLRNLLKDQPYVALAYMTGILPVKKYGQHSALNMFWEYSMTDQAFLEEYTGFTDTEVRELCKRFSMDYTETESWYDGYQFAEFRHVYNPKSVVEAMLRRRFSNYWTSTETYDALKIYMDMDFDGLRADIVRMLGGERVRVNTRSFQNDMCTFKTKDDVLTLLIHLGYLGYDSMEREAFIPNKEIREEFENAMSVPERRTAGSDEMKTNYPAGWLSDIGFVVIFANYQGKWVYSWHKRRGSFEHPGGHVEQGETAMEAARRELYEETGITDCDMMPLWDYEQRWGDGVGKNNGRVFYAKVRSLGKMPESEMSHIELFESVPENYTYNSAEEARDLERIESMLQAFA
ncbi:MAG TPA: AAA family ATPase [Lachnospiraceae bacterium]|nr:AAA family ATPase [Lachnospiraceae bacterium]